MSPTRAVEMPSYAGLELVRRVLEPVVAHDMGELALRRELLARGREPGLDGLRVVGAAADQPGARQIREAMPEAVQIFIAPPSEEALRARLVGRGTDDPDQVAARLATAREELGAQGEFGHVVVNDRLEAASDALVDCVRAHLARPCARRS